MFGPVLDAHDTTATTTATTLHYSTTTTTITNATTTATTTITAAEHFIALHCTIGRYTKYITNTTAATTSNTLHYIGL